MAIRLRAIRRKEVDEERLALAFLLLAKALHEQNQPHAQNHAERSSNGSDAVAEREVDPEAA